MGRAYDLFEKIKHEGEQAIDELIALRESEKLFLDFKTSSDNGVGKFLSQSDRGNFGKAVSGFGNSEGGVIIWGIDCRNEGNKGDLPTQKKPIQDVKKFISLLEGVVSGLTLPPHSKVEHYAIDLGKESGFVATYIPQSDNAPLQDINRKHFYIRAGSNFEPAPYQVLAGMFGKHPQPDVYHQYVIAPAQIEEETVKLQVGFLLYNGGKGIAKHLYINVKVWRDPGDNCKIAFDMTDKNNWSGGFTFKRFMSLISTTSLMIPPGAHTQPIVCYISLTPPFNSDLKIEIDTGCEGGAPRKDILFNEKDNIQKIYTEMVGTYDKKWDTEHLQEFAQALLKHEK